MSGRADTPDRPLKTCARGHIYSGDENYRARVGNCPVCFRAAQARYEASAKGKARKQAYEKTEKARERFVAYHRTDKGADTRARYDQSPKGWLNTLHKRRTKALQRRKQRKEAEDS